MSKNMKVNKEYWKNTLSLIVTVVALVAMSIDNLMVKALLEDASDIEAINSVREPYNMEIMVLCIVISLAIRFDYFQSLKSRFHTIKNAFKSK